MFNPYILLYLNALVFTAAFIWRYSKTKTFKLGEALLLLYASSAVFSIFCYELKPYNYPQISFLPFLYLYFALFISFSPIILYDNRGSYIGHLPVFYINAFCLFLIGLYVPNVFREILFLASSYKMIIANLSYFADVYSQTADLTSQTTGSSLQNISSIFRGMFSEILVFMSFYYFVHPKRNKWILTGLIISLFQPLLSSISLASRTGMTYWLLNIFIAFVLFVPYFERSIKKAVRYIIILTVVLMGSVFTLITISRFTTRGYDAYAGGSINEYMGQPMLNFNSYVLYNKVYQYGDNTAPLMRKMIGLETSKNLYERQFKWQSKMKIQQGAFYTFIGDFCFDYGIIITLIIVALLAWYIRKKTRIRHQRTRLDKLFLLFFWSSICFNGLFYFSYKTIGGNLKIIMSILFFIILVVSYPMFHHKRIR